MTLRHIQPALLRSAFLDLIPLAILPPMAAIEPVKDDVYNPSAAHAHMRALLPADARGRSSAGRWGDVLMLSSDEDEDWEDEGMDEDEDSPPPQTPVRRSVFFSRGARAKLPCDKLRRGTARPFDHPRRPSRSLS